MSEDIYVLCIKKDNIYIPIKLNETEDEYIFGNDINSILEENKRIIYYYTFMYEVKAIKISLYTYKLLYNINKYNEDENNLLKIMNLETLKLNISNMKIKNEEDKFIEYQLKRLIYKYEKHESFIPFKLENNGEISLVI